MSLIFKTSNGFTLIELIIAIMLLSAILGSMWLVYNVGLQAYSNQWTRSGVKSETSQALALITGELYLANSVTGATATSITFIADLDSNGSNDTVQYTWSGTANAPLNRVQTVPSPTVTRPLMHSVQTISFTYYGANNVLLSSPVTPSQVRLVGIDVTTTSGNETFRLRTNICLRNIK